MPWTHWGLVATPALTTIFAQALHLVKEAPSKTPILLKGFSPLSALHSSAHLDVVSTTRLPPDYQGLDVLSPC